MNRFSTGKLARLAVATLVVVVGLVLATSASWAQLTRSYVSGTVTDPTGAVIPSVKVTIINQETTLERTITTNETGLYRFAAIEPGTYTLRFEMQGFRTIEQRDVSIKSTGETVVNVSMEVAPAAMEVEVREATTGLELDRATASIGRTLGNREVKQLPLSASRDINNIALLAPNTFNAPGSTGISANGQRARNNNFSIDGTENNDVSVSLQVIPLVPEAVGEYQYQTNAYSAEFGRSSGAQINAITKSGTNSLHGEAWNYYRGSALNAMGPDEKAQNLDGPARFNRNQFGGTLGGPIIKNRTFVFGLFQGDRIRSGSAPQSTVRMPTPAGFAALSTVPLRSAGTVRGLPVGAQSAASRQAMLSALGFLPDVYALNPVFRSLSNVTVNGVPIQTGLTNIGLSQPSNFYQWLLRIDHKVSNNDSLTGRYIYNKRNQPNLISNCNLGERFCGAQAILEQNMQLSETHLFSPRVVNEFRFAYVRRNLDFPENAPNLPTVGITGFFTIGGLSNFPQGRIQNDFQWTDILSWQRGKHGFKFGADIRRHRLFNLANFDIKGTWTFPTLGDFLNNTPSNFRQALNTATFDARQTSVYLFFQDDFKVTPTFTFNYGIRYETNGVPFGFFGATDPQVQAALVPGPVERDNNNWAPRVGFAWNPRPSNGFFRRLLGDGKTVFRGGYGVSYDVLFYNILTVNASNFPRVVVSDNPDPFDVFPTQQARIVSAVFNPLALFVNAPANSVNPYAELYSFTIQRELPANFLVEFGYTGSRGINGIRQGQLNPGTLTEAQAAAVRAGQTIPSLQARRLFPQFGSRVTIETTASSSYSAFYLSVNKRLSHGLQFGANYTVSKNLSDNDESLAVAAIVNDAPPVPQDYLNRNKPEKGPSVFDRPQRLVMWYIYEMPWFKSGALSHAVLKHMFGGWQIEGITSMQSGQPFTIRTGVDSNGNGDARNDRPDLNAGALGLITPDAVTGNLRSFSVPLRTGPFSTFFTAAGVPLANTRTPGGNLGRNTFRGPGFVNFNFGVMKSVRIHESHQIQFRADFLNFFNQRDWGNPSGLMSSPNFGLNLNGPANGFAIPRTITLSLKYSF